MATGCRTSAAHETRRGRAALHFAVCRLRRSAALRRFPLPRTGWGVYAASMRYRKTSTRGGLRWRATGLRLHQQRAAGPYNSGEGGVHHDKLCEVTQQAKNVETQT